MTQHLSLPWTRLQDSLLAQAALPLYNDPRRVYHNLNHLHRMFQWAQEIGLTYDPVLDKAIWGHDSILDRKGRHEIRSTHWLEAVEPNSFDSNKLILTTVHHRLKRGGDNRLILLDLADFMSARQTRQNTADVLQEEKNFRPHLLDADIAKGNQVYLTHLRAGLLQDIKDDKAGVHTAHFEKIFTGLAQVVDRFTTP